MGLQVRELRLKEEKGMEEDYGLDQAEMNYLEQEVKVTGAKAQSTVHKYLEARVPQCLSSRRNWDSPTSSLASIVCAPPPGTKLQRT
jgi:hypothetical protein